MHKGSRHHYVTAIIVRQQFRLLLSLLQFCTSKGNDAKQCKDSLDHDILKCQSSFQDAMLGQTPLISKSPDTHLKKDNLWSSRFKSTPTASPSLNRLCFRPSELRNVLPELSFFAVPQARPQDRGPMGHVLIPITP